MCGIAGIVNLNNQQADVTLVQNMMQTIKHRGPDDEGIFSKGNVSLGHVRLSIIDLSAAGHQPMFSYDERYCIVFNGEIYNYTELKKELEDVYLFKTRTDTEVLLAAFAVWGENCLSRLNGDFAFVIYDQQENSLFGARDRFGIKPFYYHYDGNRFLFASEIKALVPHIANLAPNNKSIFDYLVYSRIDQSEETFFDSIIKLKHGHCFTIKGTEFKIKRWYNLADAIQYPSTQTPVSFREELNKSIRLRLRSDVPIGVCLSGGMDSSSITSMLYNDFNLKEVKTFSSVFEKGTWADESPYINEYKSTLKNMNFVTPSSDSLYSEFTSFINSQSEPIPTVSPYAQYKVMQLAKGNVTVTLDGQGADEMLGGYDYFYGSYFKELLKTFRWMTLLKESGSYVIKNPTMSAIPYFIYYMLPGGLKKIAERKRFGKVSDDFYLQHCKESTIAADLYNPKSLHDFFLQHFEYKLEHLLKWDDLNSMNSSIESRIPFLDHNLVEKTLSMPSGQILKNGLTKYVLRESVKDILPPKIYNRIDKKGFETPSDEWFRTKPFQVYIQELLNSKRFQNRGYLDVKDCRQKYQRHLEGKINVSKEIWKWINLEVWFRNFIDK